MDTRAAKLALARQKLKDHQEKKQNVVSKSEAFDVVYLQEIDSNSDDSFRTKHEVIYNQNNKANQNTISHKSLIEPELYHIPERNKPNLDVDVAEMFISNKRNLELEVTELLSKLNKLDADLKLEISSHNDTKQKICNLLNELENTKQKYKITLEENSQQNNIIDELKSKTLMLTDQNNNLFEQLEFTKTIVHARESENISLSNQIKQLQSDLEVSRLQMQQMINGSNDTTQKTTVQKGPSLQQYEEVLHKVENLEQQLKSAYKEKDQSKVHYEHYVTDLNEQLQSLSLKNNELNEQVYRLSNRETDLIEQISEMEIRIQKLRLTSQEYTENSLESNVMVTDLQNKLHLTENELSDMSLKYAKLQKINAQNETKIAELNTVKGFETNQKEISMAQLTADIASDKIAAQRATEQNIKLKCNIEELEEAFVKMSQDKLELTEKITAEKYLNRELTIKLAESEEKCKEIYIKLMAKDDEMIRLQTSYRDLEREFMEMSEAFQKFKSSLPLKNSTNLNTPDHIIEQNVIEMEVNNIKTPLQEVCDTHISEDLKEDAMVKLQQRFLRIMEEVADLSDEKHRLEHIILQLQNETDTICEYVALYQQQRSLLKKRDEERSSQVKLFQTECDKLKSQLEELSAILIRFAEDKELSSYFEVKTKKEDIEKVRNLLQNLKNNSLVDLQKSNLNVNNVYPCHCCSGNLIDV